MLSLEHDRDLVPNLDGRRNPAHIVDDRVSDDPSLRAWRTGAEPFIGGAAARVDPERPVVVVDYEIRRVPRGR